MLELIINWLTSAFDDFFRSTVLPNSVKWAAIGGVFLLIEVGHRAWLIIWFALGAFSAGLAAHFFPDSFTTQIAVFSAVCAGSLGAFIAYRMFLAPPDDIEPTFDPDRKVRCVEKINGRQSGLVVIDGVTYKARARDPELHISPNDWVTVCEFDVDELTAIVMPAEETVY